MKSPPDSWTTIEQRLRSEPAGPPPSPDFVQRVLRATRQEPTPGRFHPRVPAWPRWSLAGLAAAAALLILLRPTPPPQQPPHPVETSPDSDWALSAIEARAEDPLRAELEGLHGDAARALSFLADCWPSADLAAPTT